MGNEPSKSNQFSTNFVRPYTNDIYVPVGATRSDSDRGISIPAPVTLCQKVHNPSLLKSGFTGVWSIEMPNTLGPCARNGHFSVYSDDWHTLYIGYGLNTMDECLGDVWALDTLTNSWRQIKLFGEVMTPRTGSRCSMIGDHIVVFGGYNDPEYYSDLHIINVASGEVKRVQTSGVEPSPRSSPIVAIFNNKLYVWGGFNSDGYPNELNVLDFADFSWHQKHQDANGRTAVPHVIIGSKLYSYGGSKAGGMVVIDFEKDLVQIKQTIGAEPPPTVMSSGMCSVEHYAFFFGGKASSNWTLMYACDVDRLWWFVFHIMPDGETVSVADGSVSEFGLFMLPRLYSFAMTYVKEKRKIVACLGYPPKDPPPLFTVSIGEALSIIHLREDMLDLLRTSVS